MSMWKKRKYSLVEIDQMRREIILTEMIKDQLSSRHHNHDVVLYSESILRTYLDQEIPPNDITAYLTKWQEMLTKHNGDDEDVGS